MKNDSQILVELQALADSYKAQILMKFFKTGKGQYGEGDIFIGVTVPKIRGIVKNNWDKISLKQCEKILHSKIHEERLLALLLLVKKFEKSDLAVQQKIVDTYLKSTKYINNWDLVDLSAPRILGTWLLDKDRKILSELQKSNLLWERRIAIVSCWMLIRNGDLADIYSLAEKSFFDAEDLIHKAVGWMLREAGKQDFLKLEKFIEKKYEEMPRTMLRYAIEKFSIQKRKEILSLPIKKGKM